VACPYPSREAKRRGDKKRQKNLCVMFHAVLQYTLRPKAVIVRALDAACTNAVDEISNGCLNRSFANIKELPRPLFRCATLATPRRGPVRKQRHSWAPVPCFYFPKLGRLISRRIVERA
jgi:hypothetical protein